MRSRRRYRVGVVGLGIAGAAASLSLARAGHAVVAFDDQSRNLDGGAGIVLQPSGQMVLRRLGLLDAVARDAAPIRELLIDGQAGQLLRMRYDEFDQHDVAFGLHRGRLLGALQSAAVVSGVETVPEPVVALRGSGTTVETGSGVHGPFDFLVAADGARSAVRRLTAAACRASVSPFGSVWLDGVCRHRSGQQRHIVGGGQLLGLIPTGSGRCTLFWGLARERVPAWRAAGVPSWRGEVAARCPDAAELLDGLRDLAGMRWVRHYSIRMAAWHKGAVAFVGDAGHAVPPHLGQGANLALIDAEVLCQSLSQSPSPAAAFRRYDCLRRRQLRFYQSLIGTLTPLVQSNYRVLDRALAVTLKLLGAVRALRRQVWLGVTGRRRS